MSLLRVLLVRGALTALLLPVLSGALKAATSAIENSAIRIEVDPATGPYAVFAKGGTTPVLRSAQGAQVNGRWLRSSEYPTHEVKAGEFHDAMGIGREIVIR